MSISDPAYESECTDVLEDYDVEIRNFLNREVPQLGGSHQAPRVQSHRPIIDRTSRIIGLVLVVGLLVGIVVVRTSESTGAESAATNDWSESFSTPIPMPHPSLIPQPLPKTEPPSVVPVIPPPVWCDTRIDLPSYQAVVVNGPFRQPSGFYWVAGPDGRPPRIVLPQLIGMWWNWRPVPYTMCHDFILEPMRLR